VRVREEERLQVVVYGMADEDAIFEDSGYLRLHRFEGFRWK
jgi:hypothetical protein